MNDKVEELVELDYDEYMGIHADWAKSKETVDNLLRRVTKETVYKNIRRQYDRPFKSKIKC